MLSLQQHINKIAELFYRLGGDTAVICPGSRDVPLILAFSRHPKIKCIPISDERSAAFIALGVAQQTRKPVAIICTSGTAATNFYPAICEAFYQGIPLIAITADRPPEFIDQWDGQAIRQQGLFKNHILQEISFPYFLNADSMMFIEEEVKHVITKCISQQLPVHINVPIREPFYPTINEEYEFEEQHFSLPQPKLLDLHSSLIDDFVIDELISLIDGFQNKGELKLLVIIGMNHFSSDVFESLAAAQKEIGFPVIADIVSNYMLGDKIFNYDLLLAEEVLAKNLVPDILISIGGAMLSKNLKKFLRLNKPIKHFHIQEIGHVGDPFQSLSKVLRVAPNLFFNSILKRKYNAKTYHQNWVKLSSKLNISKLLESIPFCELKVAETIFHNIPTNSRLQLSNSMSVRYALLFDDLSSIQRNCNRGTSGIDGCSSTAVGAAVSYKGYTTLITGDLAFFYDVNAFWNNLHLPNLRIILLNNGGGGIFRLIEGPSALPELAEFIENAHQRTAISIATDFNFGYQSVKSMKELESALTNFYDASNTPKIMEVFTDKFENEKWYKFFKQEASLQLHSNN